MQTVRANPGRLVKYDSVFRVRIEKDAHISLALFICQPRAGRV